MRPDIETEVAPRTRPDGRLPGHRRRVTGAAIQAVLEERLRNLEVQVVEVKDRVNGLTFVIVGTVIAQVLLRLIQ